MVSFFILQDSSSGTRGNVDEDEDEESEIEETLLPTIICLIHPNVALSPIYSMYVGSFIFLE